MGKELVLFLPRARRKGTDQGFSSPTLGGEYSQWPKACQRTTTNRSIAYRGVFGVLFFLNRTQRLPLLRAAASPGHTMRNRICGLSTFDGGMEISYTRQEEEPPVLCGEVPGKA